MIFDMETKGKITKRNGISVGNSSAAKVQKGVSVKEASSSQESPKTGKGKTGTAEKRIERQSGIAVSGSAVSKSPKGISGKGIGAIANRNVQKELNQTNDSGLQSVSQGVVLGKAGIRSFQAAQKAIPAVIRTAKGVYNVAGKTIKVVKSVDSAVALLQTGTVVLNKETAARLANYTKSRIMAAAPAVKLANAVCHVQGAAKNIRKYTVQTARNIHRTAVLARGVVLGTVKIQISREDRERIKNAAVRGIKVGARTGAKGAIYAARGVYKNSVHIGKGLNKGLRSAGNALMDVGDGGVQAAGLALKGIHYTVKGVAYTPKVAKAAYKGIKGAVKGTLHTGTVAVQGSIKAYKGVRTGLRIYKKAGISKATRMYARRWGRSLSGKSRKAIAKAGNSVVTAVVEGIKSLGKKLVVPLLVVLAVIFLGSSILSAVAGAISAILSPVISDDSGNEIDETQLITQEVTAKRAGLIDELKETYRDNHVENGGNYHFIRFFNAFNESEIDFTDTNIVTSIYTVKDYVEAIQPIFHTIIICEYGGEASERNMKSLITEMWNVLNVIHTEEMPTEYCSMSVGADGTITPLLDTDGLVHADASVCPNHGTDILYHPGTDDGVLAICDSWYYMCDGHKGNCTHHCDNDCAYRYDCGGISITHLFHSESCKEYYCGHSHSAWNSAASPGCYSTYYCNSGNPMNARCSNGTRHKSCTGYHVCHGHRILALSVVISSFGDLLDKYFLDEMRTLEAKVSRTEDEEKRLGTLQESYEVCLNYMMVLEEEYGYGTGAEVVSLDGVTLTPLTEFACSFVGNPYIWGGNDPNTGADCSGFVKYVFAHFGVAMNRTAHEQVLQGTMVNGIANAQPGDLIFWSDNGTDAGVYHVAIYLGNNKIVHASNSNPYPRGGIKVSNLYGVVYKIKRML